MRVDSGQRKLENHVKPPAFSIADKKREETIKANCEQYRVQYTNPSMSVDERHEMSQAIITNEKRIQTQNETTHMRYSRKENDRLQMQQQQQQQQQQNKRRQPKERVGKQKMLFGIKI